MKKEEFAKLALMGLASGILTSNGIEALQQDTHPGSELPGKGCNSLADKCGSKCSHGEKVAGKCGGKSGCGGAVAGNCGGKGGCGGAVAGNCGGKHGCGGAVAEKCGGKSGCGGAVAGNCGGKSGCGGAAIADNEHAKPVTAPAPIPKDNSKKDDAKNNPNDQNVGYHVLTDDELTLELNDEMLKAYQAMSPETKALTRLVASARCNGTNECKGLNACKTETNSCAGKGSCKGQGKCAFSDKNLAVRVVVEKMKDKRNALTK